MSGGLDDTFVREVRDRNDIVSVVGDYVSLRKSSGQSYKGLCPFHKEKTPSFVVHRDRQFFYCFGCQTGGDVISFVRELNGYSFMEALRNLAERVGMQLPERRADDGGRRRRGPHTTRAQRDSFYGIGALAQRFFVDTLATMEGTVCRDYLRERGIDQVGIERYGLGFAPDRWDGLTNTFSAERVNPATAETLGLIVRRSSGSGYYDRFRNRLTFPIRSIAGEVVAFGGRTLSSDKEVAKYVNSPDSPVYSKGETLYGLYEARRALRRQGWGLIVEGNLDVVRVSQAGLEQVVAPMGTALTETQCRLIKRFVPRIKLLYDGDAAGIAAAEKAIPMALSVGLQVEVAQLPAGEDPDSFVGSEGVEGLRALLDKAIPGFEHLVLNCVLPRTGQRKGTQDALVIARELAPVIAAVSDRAERDLYIRKLADILGLDARVLVPLLRDSPRRRARVSATNPTRPEEAAPRPVASTPPPPSEFNLLKLLLLAPEACVLYMAHDVGALLTHEGARRVADGLAARVEAEENIDIASFIADLDDPGLRSLLYRSMADTPPIGDAWSASFAQLETRLRRDELRRHVADLKLELRRAYLAGDDEEAGRLQLKKLQLEQQLERLTAARG